MAREGLDRTEKPGWLLDPPGSGHIDPPVLTRQQQLPFTALGWEDFERLCLRLAREDGEPEDWRLYGARGQDQGGIDILVRQSTSDRYVVWQAKRHRKFTAGKVRAAVAAFLNGGWADRAERFVLCASAPFDDTKVVQALEEAALSLRARGVVLDARDPAKLSEMMKRLPEVVDDFFDRPWTEAFCGSAAARALGDRLARRDFAALRDSLETLYQAHFMTVDPGVLRASGVAQTPRAPLPLSVRFVPPDLIADSASVDSAWTLRAPGGGDRVYDLDTDLQDQGASMATARAARAVRRRDRRRVSLSTWSLEAERAVIVGAPGAGKSTLLRFLALDLLAPKPRLAALRERYPGRLPLWISFPFWTRQIQTQPPGAAISLEGVLSAWLRAHDSADLVPLVGRAIQDRRVVLLVDGVDEWADEISAVTAVGLLNTFVETRHTPAIITSRPHGTRVLGGLDDSWRRHELAPFDRGQQRDFAVAWCEFYFGEVAGGASHQARRRAEQFLAEAHRSPQIAPLTTAPLLLGGLLSLVLAGATLPDSRYRAYENLTRRILEIHPQAREQAALAPGGRDDLDPRTRERVLSALAFEIQRRPSPEAGLDAIKASTAERFCRDFLVETLDLPGHVASERARQLIAVGQESLGILVQKSPSEVGFLHRAFQEFLAAKHVVGMELDQQLSLLADHATDHRWREIFLFVAQSCERQGDVERLVVALEAAVAKDPANIWSVDLLLAEIAFGDVKRSPATARRLAARLFTYVETGANHEQRIEILKLIVAGLTWEQSRALVSTKLAEWLPDWHGANRRDALRVIVGWTDQLTSVAEVLWRNLHNDDASLRLQAAESFAKLHAGQEAPLDRLAQLISDPPSVEVAVSALAAVHAGWPQVPRAMAILEAAADSATTGLAVAGLAARVAGGDRRDVDRDRLLHVIDSDETVYDDMAGDVLVAGWRDDLMLKPVLLMDEDPLWTFRREHRLPIAIRAFPQDDDVARAVLKVTRKAKDRWLPFDTLRPLGEHFKGHGLICAAIDESIQALEPRPYFLARLADIRPSPPVKAKLLEGLTAPSSGVGHIVDALVEHWGLDDPAVAAALRDVAKWSAVHIAEVAHWLPKVFGDAEQCGRLLLDSLGSCVKLQDGRCDHLFDALKQLNVPVPEGLILDLLEYDFDSGGELAWVNACGLMGAFPDRSDVLELAKRLLVRPTGVVSGAASWLENRAEMKDAVLAVCAPLPAALRLELVDLLADRAVDNAGAFDLLGLAVSDSDHEVAGAAMLAEARTRLARDEVSAGFLERLTDQFEGSELVVGGRRISALAALALVDRLDLFEERRQAAEPIELGIWYPDEAARPMQAFAQAWPTIAAKLDVETFSHLLRLGPGGLVERMLPYADQSPKLAADVRQVVLEQVAQGDRRATLLRHMAHEPGLAGRLIDACLSQIASEGGAWPSQEATYTAAEIIGLEFADSAYAFGRILEMLKGGVPIGPVAALCDGWPACDELEAIFGRLVENDDLAADVPTPLAMKIAATKSSAKSFVASLEKAANEMTGGVWEGIPHWLPNATRRLRQDETVTADMMAHLQDKPTAGAKVSFVSLLVQAHGLTPDLAAWCAVELGRNEQALVAEAGMDLWLGQSVLVRQRLTQHLRGERG